MNKLNDNWTFWLHLPHDIDWSINSYKRLYNFSTLEDCIILVENINKVIVEKCMLFIMKNNIKPIWEDPNNCEGGCFSYKISIDNVYNIWKNMVYKLIGNTLTNNKELAESLNGISISPKKNFCIIKLWLNNIDNFKNSSIYDFLINSSDENKIDSDISDISNNKYEPFDLQNINKIEYITCKFKKHDVIYK